VLECWSVGVLECWSVEALKALGELKRLPERELPSFPSWTWECQCLRSCASATASKQTPRPNREKRQFNCQDTRVPKCNLGTRERGTRKLAESSAWPVNQKAPYKSPGVKPVFLAIRVNIRGPISSPSWNAKTTSGQPLRERIRCEPPDSRLMLQPVRKAARTRRAFAEPHWLMPSQPKRPAQFLAKIRRARSVRRGHATLGLLLARQPLRGCSRTTLLQGSVESRRSIAHPPLAQSQPRISSSPRMAQVSAKYNQERRTAGAKWEVGRKSFSERVIE
jgi:hypothetical protein